MAVSPCCHCGSRTEENKGDILSGMSLFLCVKAARTASLRLKKSVYTFISDERVNGLVGYVRIMLPVFFFIFLFVRHPYYVTLIMNSTEDIYDAAVPATS